MRSSNATPITSFAVIVQKPATRERVLKAVEVEIHRALDDAPFIFRRRRIEPVAGWAYEEAKKARKAIEKVYNVSQELRFVWQVRFETGHALYLTISEVKSCERIVLTVHLEKVA